MTHPLIAVIGSVGALHDQPLYRQVVARVQGAIARSVLRPGDRVPSARALAQELGVARGTIEQAYSVLVSEGYLLARGQAGTVVNPELRITARAAPEPVADVVTERAPDVLHRPQELLPFQMGVPALDAFPRKRWARLGAQILRSTQIADLDYPVPHGLPALRAAVASYLQVARGVNGGAHQVFITAGWSASLQLLCKALLRPGQRAWVEDPGFPVTRRVLQHAGLDTIAVPVDSEGLDVARGMAVADDAALACVTPAHQSPLSMSLSLPRRQALLAWAQTRGAWIVEDDYDGEFRYVSRPLPALASLDQDGRVIYAGTFSKVLFPGIRLAYLVVPNALVPAFERADRLSCGAAPTLTQAMVAAFIAQGHFTRHIQRMRTLYAERRSATAAALELGLQGRLRVEPQPGGMHLILRLPGQASDLAMAQHLLAAGMAVQPLSPWWASGRRDPGLLLSFTQDAAAGQAQRLGSLVLQQLQG